MAPSTKKSKTSASAGIWTRSKTRNPPTRTSPRRTAANSQTDQLAAESSTGRWTRSHVALGTPVPESQADDFALDYTADGDTELWEPDEGDTYEPDHRDITDVGDTLIDAIWADIDAKLKAGGSETLWRPEIDATIAEVAFASVEDWAPKLDKERWEKFAANPSFSVDVKCGPATVPGYPFSMDLYLNYDAGPTVRASKYTEVQERKRWIGLTQTINKHLFPAEDLGNRA